MPRVTVYFSEKSAEDMRLFRWLVRLPPYQRGRHFKRLALARLINGAGRPGAKRTEALAKTAPKPRTHDALIPSTSTFVPMSLAETQAAFFRAIKKS
ncbi:MAG: hypothetical protein KF890_14440 [Nitrospira sp.]|nr:hypothetical protein [Nitrospira sp.]